MHVAESILAYVCDARLMGRSTWVFSHADGRRMEDLKNSVKRTSERAGLEGVTSHVIRHSVGSLLAEGLDLVVVRDHLGHSDLRITSRYLHGSDDQRKRAAERLGQTVEAMGSGSENVVALPRKQRIHGAES